MLFSISEVEVVNLFQAVHKPEEGHKVSGILVKRNFNYHIVSPAGQQHTLSDN
jgi:hypothetical protein